MSQNRNSTKVSRRKKRIANKNGDRQFYQQVKTIKRRRLLVWHTEHNPELVKKTAAKQALQAAKRMLKQQARDKAREDAVA